MIIEADDIAELLAALSGAQPDAPALTFYRGRQLQGRLTYGELIASARRMTAELQSLGVKRGDRVALLTPNRLEVPPLLLAIWTLGAVAVPLNPTLPETDWPPILKHSGASGLIGTAELPERAQYDAGFRRDIDNFAAETQPREPPALGKVEGEPAILLYTSGTTGAPKGVTLEQRNLLRNAWSMARNFGLDRTTQLAVLPLYHAHALGFGLMSALVSGGHLVFMEKLDPFAWAEVIRLESVELTSVVPNLIPPLLLARVNKDAVPTLRAIMVSSAPLASALAKEFETKTGLPLIQGWGLSEYTNFACCLSPHDSRADHERLMFGWEVPSIGPALDGTQVTVLDASGAECAEGLPGELCIRGHSRMIGYFDDPQATQNTVVDGWLHSGDLGLWREFRGRRVYFIAGRIKEIIIRGAEKYSPVAIEERMLEQLPELRGRLVVLGFPHEMQGEEVGAYVEAEPLPEELRAKLGAVAQALPVEIRPKVILHGAAPVPRTHTGKVQRRKLVALFAEHRNCRGPVRIP
jgi:acyl-CoA synthetase (AMP-forming)/AMP-acid ligase II